MKQHGSIRYAHNMVRLYTQYLEKAAIFYYVQVCALKIFGADTENLCRALSGMTYLQFTSYATDTMWSGKKINQIMNHDMY